jgi:hypothetical protein
MKTKRLPLSKWRSSEVDIDIDWPRVQRDLGEDQVEWLLKQPSDQCQLVLDKHAQDFTLFAEFYSEQLLITYHLMWSRP